MEKGRLFKLQLKKAATSLYNLKIIGRIWDINLTNGKNVLQMLIKMISHIKYLFNFSGLYSNSLACLNFTRETTDLY